MKRLWSIVEKCMHFGVYKVLKLNLSEKSWNKWCQFVKFCVVGLSNTFIYYVVYVILVSLSLNYLISSFLGFFVSVINAYYWNDRYVFKEEDDEQRVWWKIFLKSFMAYAGTGLLLNNILLILWVRVCGIHELLAPILNIFITTPINFIVNKLWAYRKRNNQ